VVAIRCPHCACLHLDAGPLAGRRRIDHVCTQCAHGFKHAPAVSGNPLGVFAPVLRDGHVFVSRMPSDADVIPQHERLGALSVEPTFLGNLARYTLATSDPRVATLKEKAGSMDGLYHWVNRSDHRVL